MENYCTKNHLSLDAVRFLFDGDRLDKNQTPKNEGTNGRW